MEQLDPLNTTHPHNIPYRSTPPDSYAELLLMCYDGGEIDLLLLKESCQRSELSNKGGTYIEEPHMVLPQKRRVWRSQPNNEDNGNLGEEEERQSERERGKDRKEQWDDWFEHPHMQWTHKSKHLGSLLASPLLLLPYTPAPSQPTTPAVGFYLSCVQAQASVKGAEGSVGASALSSGRETRASITCNIELLGHFCTSDL